MTSPSVTLQALFPTAPLFSPFILSQPCRPQQAEALTWGYLCSLVNLYLRFHFSQSLPRSVPPTPGEGQFSQVPVTRAQRLGRVLGIGHVFQHSAEVTTCWHTLRIGKAYPFHQALYQARQAQPATMRATDPLDMAMRAPTPAPTRTSEGPGARQLPPRPQEALGGPIGREGDQAVSPGLPGLAHLLKSLPLCSRAPAARSGLGRWARQTESDHHHPRSLSRTTASFFPFNPFSPSLPF